MGENINSSTTKVNISDYSSELVANLAHYSSNQKFEFLNQDGILEKILYSPNFYDTDSEVYKKIILQEKLNGSYII